MKPEPQKKLEYERVSTDDFLKGKVEEIQLDPSHTFKGFQGQPDKVTQAVRFKFSVEGYQYPHYSRWMKFTYGEKSNLFTKFLVPLVEGAKPDMDFDLELLKGMEIKMLWKNDEKSDFQNIETIRPLKGKVKALPEIQVDKNELEPDEDVPF